jgi:hypothetical protein
MKKLNRMPAKFALQRAKHSPAKQRHRPKRKRNAKNKYRRVIEEFLTTTNVDPHSRGRTPA